MLSGRSRPSPDPPVSHIWALPVPGLEDNSNMVQPIYLSHEMFKRTIVKQEFVFREQVLELHRLYSIQKTLMRDIGSNHANNHVWIPNTQPPAQEIRSVSDSTFKFGSMPPRNPDWLEESKSESKSKWHKFHKPSLHLQLSPDQFVGQSENVLPCKKNTRSHCRRTLKFDSIHVDAVSDPLELNLSLSLGMGNNRKENRNHNLFNKKTISNSVIDLDPSTECLLDVNAKDGPSFGCSAPVIVDGVKSDSQVSATSDPITSVCTEEGLLCKEAKGISSSEESQSLRDGNSSIQGFGDRNCNLQHHVHSTRKQLCVSSRVGYIDLNQVQPDDSCCFSNDPMVVVPSATSSSSEFDEPVRKMLGSFSPAIVHGEDVNISDYTSNMLAENTIIDATLTGSKINDHSAEILGDTKLVRMCEDEASLSPGSASVTCKHLSEDVGCLHDPNGCYIGEKSLNSGKSEGDDNCSGHSDITVEEKHCRTTPASAKSCSVGDSDSSCRKTSWSIPEHQKSKKCSPDQLVGVHKESSQVARILAGDQGQASSGGMQLVYKCCDQKEELGDVDFFVRTAAESLIEIYLQNPACYPHCPTPAPDEAEKEDELPLCSSDSFELIALRLTESNAEDSCVSSKPVEAIDSERKQCRLSLRRGSRLKDFRKDILPSIACLSRHEIREDINILQGVLRSREYKRMRGKEARGETWCIPIKSKRSRQKHVRRKNFR